jgi:hypothetical protein
MSDGVERSQLSHPVPGDSSVGVDLSFDPDFVRIKREIDQYSTLHTDVPNWSAVAKGCENLLVDRTKDLRLLVWLAIARLQTDGLAGFRSSLAALRDATELYWDRMYPSVERMRARAKLLNWLWEQAGILIARRDVGADVKELADLLEECADVSQQMERRLGESYEGLGQLANILRTRSDRISPPAEPDPRDHANDRVVVHGTEPTRAIVESDRGGEEPVARWEAGFQAAVSRVRDGDVKSLISAYEVAGEGGDGRKLFLAKLELVRLAREHGEPRMAGYVLESLATEISQRRLEAWEPKLCLRVYEELFDCLRAMHSDETKSRERDLITKIGGLDPTAATRLRLSSGA